MPEIETTETETVTTEVETKPETPEVDWKAKAREWEKRAKANADAATKLAQLEESQKSEAQKLVEAKEAAERDAVAARAESLRYKVAAQYGINSDDAETFLTGIDEDTLTRQAERLATLAHATDSTAPAPRPDLSQGRSSATTGDPAQDFGRFIQRQLNS